MEYHSPAHPPGTTTKYCRQGYVHVALHELASRPTIEQPAGLSAVLSVFGAVSGRCVEGDDRVPTTIQFTGFTSTTDEIHGGLSNVFLPSKKAPPQRGVRRGDDADLRDT